MGPGSTTVVPGARPCARHYKYTCPPAAHRLQGNRQQGQQRDGEAAGTHRKGEWCRQRGQPAENCLGVREFCVCVWGGHLTPSSLFSHGGSTCRSNSKVDWGRHSSTEKGHASSHRGRKAGQRLVNPFYRFCTVDLFPCAASSFFPTFQSP